MKTLQKQLIDLSKVIVLALILAAGLQYAGAATSWTPAAGAPPGNNTYAPLNVGAAGQTKSGGITVGTGNPERGFQVSGGEVWFTSPALGTPSNGYVLKSNGAGKVTWQADATGGGGGGGGVNCTGTCLQNQLLKFYQSGQIVTGGLWETYDSGSGRYRLGVNKAAPGFEVDVQGRVNATEYCTNGVCGGSGGNTVSYATSPASNFTQTAGTSSDTPFWPDNGNPDGDYSWVSCPPGQVITAIQIADGDTGSHRRYRIQNIKCAALKTP